MKLEPVGGRINSHMRMFFPDKMPQAFIINLNCDYQHAHSFVQHCALDGSICDARHIICLGAIYVVFAHPLCLMRCIF
jgi:hypothetical protein